MSAEHRITTLDSGVRVVSERVPGVRSVALGYWLGTGSAFEREAQAGISHLLEHMLFRGTEHFGSREIDEIFDAMGAEINAGTDKETTSLYTRVLDVHFERAFEVMSDMVWRPRFGELEAEREVVLEEIAMYEDDPQDRVFDLLGATVFGSHPLGRPVIGTAEVVRTITREQLAAFHAERYVPEDVVIAAAGSIEHDALVELAAAAGQTRTPGARDAREEPLPTAVPLARRARFLEKDTEQYHVCLGGPGIERSDERRFALRVLEGVLGATSSSRLFQEVRERRGLAYSVFTFSNLYAHTGDVGLYVGTRPDNVAQAMAVIAEELERCVEGVGGNGVGGNGVGGNPFTQEELARSRENLKGRVVLGMESTGARMSRLGGSLLGELPILSIDEVIERIDAVELEDLRELAAELFAPARLSAAGVGPSSSEFLASIEPLGVSELQDAGAPAAGARAAAGRGRR